MNGSLGSLARGGSRRAFPGQLHPTGVVLLVEDDQLVANALRLLLVRAEYEVHVAADVQEALPAFDAQPVDVVVTDLLMPGATGLDLLREIEQRDPQMPVIIVTADHSVQAAAAAVREHAFDYLTKPVKRERLLDTVERAVKARRQTQIQQHEQERLREEHRQLSIRHQRTAMLLSVLYNRAAEGIIVVDPEGRVVDVSESFVNLVDKPLYSLLDTDLREWFEPSPTGGDVQDLVIQMVSDSDAETHWRGEVTVRAGDRQIPARMSLSLCESPEDEDHGPTRYVIGLVYFERSHEEVSQRLQRADRLATVGLLAGSAAHEIKNELGPLLGYLTMMETSGADPVETGMIGIMRDSVRRIHEHVEEILEPLRPRVRTRGAVVLRESVEDILKLLRRAGRLRRMKVEVEQLGDDDIVVHADKDEVHQISLNLISNAIDALGDGGGGDRGNVRISMRRAGDYGVLRVEDDGEGIAEELRSRVFEPFFTTKGSAGTGLGLAVVHDIVRSLRGRVVLDCPEEGGTIVTVALPRYRG
ncbi:hybrid sensor histidine kinase/response regulator [Paraliomyxa miuraensis]|uniref:hybrid sensor histidine kinase/response regulator n=1 Tax=Paraliomyxa miuraensis TaxID=376150 RepID=UPI00225B2BEC|nr:response regulator [Paraliomyxa miuraensis]MCX4244034.1 response regulator [Paraliomyxa miuraensis]